MSGDFDIEFLAADELSVRGFFRWVVERGDDAVFDLQFVCVNAQSCHGETHELLPGSGRGLADLRAGAFNSAAAAGGRLVDGESGVALDDFDLFPRHVQLFGGDLRQGGQDASP